MLLQGKIGYRVDRIVYFTFSTKLVSSRVGAPGLAFE